MYVEYEYKQTRRERSDILDFNKGRAVDWNILKDAININYDELLELKDSSGSGITVQSYEAIVRYDGDDNTGQVGSYEFSFATPTAAAVALRAYVGTQRLMTIKAGTYVAEDCLFADGTISCDDGVILDAGDNNAIFENIDGRYYLINFYILGYPTLNKSITKKAFNITSPLQTFVINAEQGADNLNIINASFLTIKANHFDLGDITCSWANIDIYRNSRECTIRGEDFLGAAPPWMNINIIQPQGIVNLVSNGVLDFAVINYHSDVGFIFTANGKATFNITGDFTWRSDISLELSSSSDVGIYNLNGGFVFSGSTGSPIIKIADNSTATFDIKGKYTHKNNGEIIDCGTPQTVDVSASLSMITTASPKVGANIIMNDIRDY